MARCDQRSSSRKCHDQNSWTRLCAIRLHEEFSSVRVQVGNATIRLKLTSDQARCDQARGRGQFCQSSSRKCHAPQTLAGSVVQPFCLLVGIVWCQRLAKSSCVWRSHTFMCWFRCFEPVLSLDDLLHCSATV